MESQFSLKNKHIVIVGASSGIGAEIATQCSKSGARVSICARREQKLIDVLRNLDGKEHGYQLLDVRNTKQVAGVFDNFVAERGRIDGFVYCIGILKNMAFGAIKTEQFLDILQVNLLGAMVCTQAAINIKRVNKENCSIVWISSVAYKKPGGAGGFMYAASKGGMVGGVKVLALELAKRNIRINAICPAAVETEIWNINTMTEEEKINIFKRHLLGIGQPIDVANACIYLLSPASKWLTGTELFLDGGYLLT